MRKVRKYSKNKIVYTLVLGTMILLFCSCLAGFLAIGNMLEAQEAAERFRNDSETRFAQVSAFFPVGKGKALSDIYTFRDSIGDALTEASLEEPETGKLWIDAYSANGEVTVKGTRGSATVPTLGVGGDWFAFHPLRLRSGSYISETDLMHDKVVLDEELAWKLFGGVDLAGMEVTIGDKPYLVAGVIAREDDFASEKAYAGGAGMFMYYDELNALSESEIASYELVCADPISGFALNILDKGFADAATVENTGRFSFIHTLGAIRHFGENAMGTDGMAYPYWENAARYAQTHTALLLVLTILFALFPLFCGIRRLVLLGRKGKDHLSEIIPAWWEKVSDRIRERQRLRLEQKAKSK